MIQTNSKNYSPFKKLILFSIDWNELLIIECWETLQRYWMLTRLFVGLELHRKPQNFWSLDWFLFLYLSNHFFLLYFVITFEDFSLHNKSIRAKSRPSVNHLSEKQAKKKKCRNPLEEIPSRIIFFFVFSFYSILFIFFFWCCQHLFLTL